MPEIATMKVGFTYAQLLNLAMQMQPWEKEAFCRDLQASKPSAVLGDIRQAWSGCSLTDDEIRQECEIVRQEMYDKIHCR